MHGLGNDFVVVDGRTQKIKFSPDKVRAVAARVTGVGCDQLIVIEPSKKADAFMRIYNADGGEVAACGNASRCIGDILMRELGQKEASIETKAGVVKAYSAPRGQVTVDMGKPKLEWKKIPLSEPRDTLDLGIVIDGMSHPVGVSMGNPHAVFFVADVDKIDVEKNGPQIQAMKLFPESVNVGVAQVIDRQLIKLRVYERGAGETQACGTGACAALVAAVRRKLIDGRKAAVHQRGGVMHIEWRDDDRVLMTGPVATVFEGSITL